jgi:glucosamine kinase
MPGVTQSVEPVAAVDGGGSKTVAVVVDAQGRELGRATAGSSNATVVGTEHAANHVRHAVADAVRLAGAVLPLRSIWIGLSGIDRPGMREQLHPLLRSLSVDIRLTNDAELIYGALDGGVGVVLIAGTGSIAIGRDSTGATARAGGWGHVMGDEGSGYDLGRRALQAAARAADGRGPETRLLDAFMHHWRIDLPLAMIERVYKSSDKSDIAVLASLVLGAARDGDTVARQIVADAAGELAKAAIAANDRLTFSENQLPLALTGGLMTGEPDYRAMVLRRIRNRRPVGQVRVVDDPALTAARGLLGVT